MPRTVSLADVRRLAIVAQGLAGPRPRSTAPGVLDLVRRLGCLQIDPTSVVARTQLLVLHARLGRVDPAALDRLAYSDQLLFEYWAHEASFVLADDLPIHLHHMRTAFAGESVRARRVRAWLEANATLRASVLARLAADGPLRARELERDGAAVRYDSTGWGDGRTVSRMLELLSVTGEALVARREGGQRLWDLGERCLPADAPREVLAPAEVTRRAVLRALGALGVARPAHVRAHFTRGRYPGLEPVLDALAREGVVEAVEVLGDDGARLPGPWWVRTEDLPALEAVREPGWRGRTELLSPFDNLVCDRARTELLWGFRFRLEIYVPKAEREYGFFVMPVLRGDELIARIDPALDRRTGVLRVHAVHPEPGLARSAAAARAVAGAVARLAAFLGADSVVYESVPDRWAALGERSGAVRPVP